MLVSSRGYTSPLSRIIKASAITPMLPHSSINLLLSQPRCRIREYQAQHLLHLQTQPLKAQQSDSAGINKERRGTGSSEWWRWCSRGVRGLRIEKQSMTDRQRESCSTPLVLIRVAICQSGSQRKRQEEKNELKLLPKMLCTG